MKLYTLLATALLSALPLCAMDWNPVSSGKWKKQDGEMSYEGAEFARLSAKKPMEENTFYRFSWQGRSSAPGAGKCLFQIVRDKKLAFQKDLTVGPEWQENSAWFYSGVSGDAMVHFTVPGKTESNWNLRDFKIQKYTPDEMERLVWNDGFEGGSLPLNFYLKSTADGNSLKVAQDDSFISGTQSLVFEVGASTPRPDGIRSHYIPVLPGKTYSLTFRGKSVRELAVQAGISIWPSSGRHTGKHIARLQKFAFGPEWKKYTMEFTLPNDVSTYPDLNERSGQLIFMTSDSGASGAISLDEISLKVIR